MKLQLGFVLKSKTKMKQGLHLEYFWAVFAELNNGASYAVFLKCLCAGMGFYN